MYRRDRSCISKYIHCNQNVFLYNIKYFPRFSPYSVLEWTAILLFFSPSTTQISRRNIRQIRSDSLHPTPQQSTSPASCLTRSDNILMWPSTPCVSRGVCDIIATVQPVYEHFPFLSAPAPLLQELPGHHVADADLHQRRGLHHRHPGAPQRDVHPERGVH